MAHLIDKDVLVAEIEIRMNYQHFKPGQIKASYAEEEDRDILSFLDTLDVKEIDTKQLTKLLNWWKDVTSEHSVYKVKEVDLEEEIKEVQRN